MKRKAILCLLLAVMTLFAASTAHADLFPGLHQSLPTSAPHSEEAPSYGAFANVEWDDIQPNGEGCLMVYYNNVWDRLYQGFGEYLMREGFRATASEVKGNTEQTKISDGIFDIDVVYYGDEKKLLLIYQKGVVPAKMSTDYVYSPDENGNDAEIIRYNASHHVEDLVIPEILGGESVVALYRGAFEFCSFNSVTIPDNIYICYGNPFERCSVQKINISSTHSCLAIADGILIDKRGNELISFLKTEEKLDYAVPQGIERIAEGAFGWCDNLQSVFLPNSVKTIGDEAFYTCHSLESIILSDGVTDIGTRAFGGCWNLKNVTIPGSVETIGDGAFMLCYDLTSVTIPESVETIGNVAFYGCKNLTSVTLGNGLKSIGKDAFAGCDNLTVTVQRGSFAEAYCKANGLKYVYGK